MAVHHEARNLITLVRVDKLRKDEAINKLRQDFSLEPEMAQTLFAEAEDFKNLS
ncbi:MAG TPA: hypothetical protein VLH19_01210 [Patescibacteria group bacterium]|nr:hypothetical protein [Patescibacteria group bacterium]